MTRVGVTGTRGDITEQQQFDLEIELALRRGGVLLHGDCVGVDALAHDFARTEDYVIEVYPPTNERYRAFKEGDVVHSAADYRSRNQKIVDGCDVLIAVPEGPEAEFPRSGTWMTVRMARRAERPIVLLLPDTETK